LYLKRNQKTRAIIGRKNGLAQELFFFNNFILDIAVDGSKQKMGFQTAG
jgi:hypothetical protein